MCAVIGTVAGVGYGALMRRLPEEEPEAAVSEANSAAGAPAAGAAGAGAGAAGAAGAGAAGAGAGTDGRPEELARPSGT
ncbi:hypothetical protein GCM10020256_41830 [Streptomyces thermocoprophilus]